MNRREELLIEALLEYVQRYGIRPKTKEAFDVLGSDELLRAGHQQTH